MDRATFLKELDSITVQLIEKYKPEKIILFGSATRGEGEINDIDLVPGHAKVVKGEKGTVLFIECPHRQITEYLRLTPKGYDFLNHSKH